MDDPHRNSVRELHELHDYLALLGGLVLYTVLLLAAGLIDLHRRNL